MKNVTVMGSGSWGTALAILLQKNGHSVMLWARRSEQIKEMEETRENAQYLPNVQFPEGLQLTSDKEKALAHGEIIILSVPSKAVRQSATDFAPYLKAGQVVVNVAKGLEEGSLKRLSEVIRERIPQCEVATLSGPSHAEEVARGIPTICLVASPNEDVAKMVQDEFGNSAFRLYTNTDEIGVEMGAALKNVMALAAGMSDGLGFGDNTKAAIMTRGITEMARLGIAVGGKRETFGGISGIGDLIVTCTSMHSRNRRAGILLGQGKSLEETLAEIKMVVEGVNTVKAACDLAHKMEVELPITEAIYAVLFQGKDREQAVLELMNRENKAE